MIFRVNSHKNAGLASGIFVMNQNLLSNPLLPFKSCYILRARAHRSDNVLPHID